ncbi:SusC/RagA family TonB-linked outer membrane protein [Cellulophaga sp. F20128]|uniref:SusC/RagA family TonB-linked outer membrane protein n=1 Tax=Cellulophaga sp. F20128 TaxID=2926413 RepID=UPI001FF21700|nr:SusC/RagA family TonB-linked outer membrane protein [Cellulophaga sp. F20128]MCK0158819.1 SusC/RagA family TonB-linked outer membrane protein [Cellulophaga sp. F20128]
MKIVLIAVMQLFAMLGFAQTNSYTAKIVDQDNQPIPFATVHEIGTQNYTTTNIDGEFTLVTTATNFSLRISSIGFVSKDIRVTNSNLRSVLILEYSSEQLNEIVVTALGIEREKQSLVSAVTMVSSEKLTDVILTNVVNSLAGQVAGVQVTNGSSGVGSSSRIVIRGENSLSGSNQPLFVVDGVPISNEQITSNLVNNGALQEVDYGNGGAELSTDDIAAISILKGAGSAALYGARAANGVVLITTKRGTNKKGFGVTTSSSLTIETPLTLPDYQNVYGGGSNGVYSFQNGAGAGIQDGGLSSYGPKLDQGLLINQFNSPSVDINGNPVRAGDVISRTYANGTFTPITATPWVSNPNNVRNFFKTGVTQQHNIAINSSGENGSSRISYSNLRNTGIVPNTDLDRDGISLSVDQKLSEKLNVNTFVNYINTRSGNRPNLGYGYENPLYGFNWTGRQANVAALKNYWQAGQENVQHYDINYRWLTNPYLTVYENTNSFDKNRILGNAAAVYDFSDKLRLSVRAGMDMYNDKREFRRAVSTNANPEGSFREDNINFRELNTDVLLSYTDVLNEDWKYTLSGGANRFDQEIKYSYAEASQLAIPDVYTLANSKTPLVGNSSLFTKRINSLYTTGNLAYKNSLYFDFTYRNDWSSTLPANSNSFGYYSAGFSYVVSNMFQMPEAISFLNLRFSAASVGNDTDPYQNSQNFLFNQNYGADFRITNETVLKNANIKPERLNAYEAGLEAWFLNGSVQFDVAAYQNTSVDQIISRPISQASGFGNFNVNGGKVRTRGFEALVSGTIVKGPEFQWQSSVNFSTFKSVVTELPEGVDQFVTGTANIFSGGGGSNTVFYIARENGRVGDMYGTGFVAVDGQIVHDSKGLPVQDPNLRLLGNYNPDFTMGLNNKFSYKDLDITLLFDWRKGGTIVSRTKALGSTAGVLKETLVGRETGIVGSGVVNTGTVDNPQYTPNTTVVSAQDYNNAFYDRGNEASALYSASYVKLRQLSIYYNFPEKLVNSMGVNTIKVGVVGSNLLLFTENPHFDPELNALQEQRITYGVEDFSYPSTRSFGVSLKTEF